MTVIKNAMGSLKQRKQTIIDKSLHRKDGKYYITKDYYNMKSGKGLHIISHFDTFQQTTEYTCGCTSLRMVLHYYGIDDYSDTQIAEIAGTDQNCGTTPEGICRVLDHLGLKYESHISTEAMFHSIEDAEEFFLERLDKGIPIMVDWEDWGGHWQTVIGIDTLSTDSVYDDIVIFADPYDVTDHTQDGYYVFSFARFASMWREGACSGKNTPYEQPYIAIIGDKILDHK